MNELTITEYKNVRVLTTQQIAEAYETNSDVISKNFKNNENRYKEGKHYICLTGDELREAKANGNIYGLPMNANKFYLWTEKGCFLHAKSLGTDKAWEVYENLVDFYFNRKKQLSIPEQIKILAQGNEYLEEKIDSVDKDLQDFKKDMPLLALECQRITRAKNQKVVPLMGGKNSPAYKNNSLRGKVYRDIEGQLRREFGVDTYKAIKRNQCDLAVKIIQGYELPMALSEQIADENAQLEM